MTTATLDEIKAEHARLAEKITALEAQATVHTYAIPETVITLQVGEHYAGIIVRQQGEPSYHLVLLPGDAEDLTHQAATEWAASNGGDLPDRPEQALLYANLKSQFQEDCYWSAALHESDPDYAWCQYFYYGSQLNYLRYDNLRARAVRRLIIH